ncbi:Coiled-coil domain-containing protein 12 [Tetrabaena socialis]|uniref:Coiled-coil domain-containing protein 12 n=1 Tax=Tetrabaena socialis TaxID=47790 RepID=A0A2J7ZTC4_9CHLO|nr:Coiled-coil domain-containing protein 12 [Tetrabaena socialis]|eukprot:PNH03523.1 Coiled-coil domain-containing protein 12 [Tetrabaena socialis]
MDDALARRERLKALRAAAAAAEGGQAPEAVPAAAAAADADAGDDAAVEADKPVLKFRNYAVQDTKRIDHERVAAAQPPKFQEPVVETKPEELPQEELLVNIAPKKANWDLKRDVQPKLDKLERRTQRAMLEMMREEERKRLEEEGGVQD